MLGMDSKLGAEVEVSPVAESVGVNCVIWKGRLSIELNILFQDGEVQSGLVWMRRSSSGAGTLQKAFVILTIVFVTRVATVD